MEAFGLGPLPNGWECKIEPKTSRLYFINHSAKSTTWEDPRLYSIPTPPYHIAITQPTAYFEDTGGSRWSSPVPSLRGFTLHRRGSSPRLGGSPRIAPLPTPPPRHTSIHPNELVQLSRPPSSSNNNHLSSNSHLSQLQIHNNNHLNQHHGNSSSTAEPSTSERPLSARSFSSSSYCGIPSSFLSTCDPETAYRAVCALFPTAGEPHIRHLFHKYHNRATLVVSALQVEKHPFMSEIANQLDKSPKRDGDTDTVTSIPGDSKSIGINSPMKMNSYTTGSPARTGTPVSLLKFSNPQSSAGSLFTARWGSPQLSMSPQLHMVREELKTPKSPKMKLKYMKGIFPAADETFLLDVLSSCENNVQKASEKMLKKGFTRTPPCKPARQKWLEVKTLIEKRQKALDQQKIVNNYHLAMGEPLESPFPTPIMKAARPHLSLQQKSGIKATLVQKFPNLPERFISWALEAAQFDLDKTETLLQEVGPQTPDEFKPFVTGEIPTKASRDEEQRRIRFADDSTTVAEVVEVVMSNSQNKELGLVKRDSVDSNEENVDSGYFELEVKSRKKNFIANLFNIKSDKEKEYIMSSKKAKGPNSSYAKGPNPSLIQTNYIQVRGPSALSRGPNPSYRQGSQSNAQGPNPSLAKGSIWSNRNNNTGSKSQHAVLQHVAVEG